MTRPQAPKNLGPAGSRLWKSVVSALELREDELVLFRDACRITDSVEALQAAVERDGVLVNSAKTGELVPHPGLVEARQQRIVLARMLATLRFPDEDGHQAQRRAGGRGAYLRDVS